MNLKEVRKLQINDAFRRPSTNSHDNGFRKYRVNSIELLGSRLMAFSFIDQHGYHGRISLEDWHLTGGRDFMKPAQLIDRNDSKA